MIDPAALPVLERPAQSAQAYDFHDPAILGTRMNLAFVADSYAHAHLAAIAVRAEIDRLAALFDTRRADCEISRLNASSAHIASPDLFRLISEAEAWRDATAGAYSPRLGRLVDLWNAAACAPPEAARLADLAAAASAARLQLDPATRVILRPAAIRFAPDGFAKGWIVDRALEVAHATPGVSGAMIDIGGEVRVTGAAPDASGWIVGLPDPRMPFDNAPIVAAARLADAAIATSGRGPRDRLISGRRHSPTLSPIDGQPVEHAIAASVIAPDAASADALATAMLVLPPDDALALAAGLGVAARLTPRSGDARTTPSWSAYTDAPALVRIQANSSKANASKSAAGQWHDRWQALATFTAPRRQLIRDPDFRSPYMAMWITDMDNKPVRTLILVGKRAEWQKDNYLWWQMNRAATGKLMATRSMSTSGSGVYNVFWDGVDDAGKPVAAGKYVLHVETSRERGKHTYRSLNLDFSKAERFNDVLPPTEEGGGITVGFDRY
jgi:thiamine biosynthesis lipoprotein